MTQTTAALLHLTPADYHVIRPEDFGAPGLVAREAVGPFVRVQALGSLVTVHDSTFEPGRGIGHHPHQRMERLFYVLEGTVDHDDALNGITGHMGTGDLGILTEGRRGMIHSEWNHSEGTARCWILVYPNEPLAPSAAFDAIRDGEAPRVEVAPGAVTKQVVARGEQRVNGDVRELGDTSLQAGAAYAVELDAHEAGIVFVLGGSVTVHGDGHEPVVADREHTVLLPPTAAPRSARVAAPEASRVLHAVTGAGFGLRLR